MKGWNSRAGAGNFSWHRAELYNWRKIPGQFEPDAQHMLIVCQAVARRYFICSAYALLIFLLGPPQTNAQRKPLLEAKARAQVSMA